MKRLAIDIETSPNLADVWGLWNQNVSLSQLRESTRMLCFAAQWEEEGRDDSPMFFSEWEHGPELMAACAHQLLDDADVVVHYNGRKFDIPHLNREFLEHGFEPPSPYKQVDLMREIKKTFRLPSYKLAYVAPTFGVGEKVSHEGHELWVKVMAGDRQAQLDMQYYCERDTELLFPLYRKVLPWIETPNAALDGESQVCTACGSASLRPQGFALLRTGKYQRFQCRDCGKWSRGTKRIAAADITPVAS